MEMVLRQDREGIALLTLNAPNRLNPLSRAMIHEISAQLDTIAARSPHLRAVILKGAGRAFCAGHDLREIQDARTNPDGGHASHTALFQACAAMMKKIRDLPQPVIAQVQGLATAAGCQLVATCDLAIASTEARFGVNGVDIGLFCATPMVALTRNIPRKHAFELLTTGGFLSAQKASELGLVNEVVAPETLNQRTWEMAQLIASKLPSTVATGKAAFYAQADMSTEEAYRHTTKVITTNLAHPDTAEGIQAFLEKRPPRWK